MGEYLLLREMHHRMANTLMLLISLLQHEFGSPAIGPVGEAVARYEARIAAFGNLHRLLTVGMSSDPIDVQDYVEHLCHALSDAVLEPRGLRCEVFVEMARLPSDLCERFGLVIAELVTNAAKHAFNGRRNGLVRVELIGRMGAWHCSVCDNGTGMSAAAGSGAGSKILHEMAKAIEGELVFQTGPGGTSVTVTRPM